MLCQNQGQQTHEKEFNPQKENVVSIKKCYIDYSYEPSFVHILESEENLLNEPSSFYFNLLLSSIGTDCSLSIAKIEDNHAKNDFSAHVTFKSVTLKNLICVDTQTRGTEI